MNIVSRFIHFYHNEFVFTELYEDMRNTVEDSPWHREVNVAVHTNMVVSQYLARAGSQTARNMEYPVDWLCGALAVTFHDVGKPEAEEVKFSEERGEYRRYGGHEMISARLWEDYAVTNFDNLQEWFPEFNERHILVVAWIIEHHLPFGLKKTHKLDTMASMIANMFESRESAHVFFTCLNSDCEGRISDDHATKIQNTRDWCNDFIANHLESPNEPAALNTNVITDPTLYMLIGTSGCGKSTYRSNLLADNPDLKVFSLDDVREERYLDDAERGTETGYKKAFDASCNDKSFNAAADAIFNAQIKNFESVIVDNVNASAKRRNKYTTMARTHGYRVVGVVFPNTLDTLLKRQIVRPDKTVPDHAVRQQYFQIQMPSYGEVDEIRVIKTF